jgi:hypothetical protein
MTGSSLTLIEKSQLIRNSPPIRLPGTPRTPEKSTPMNDDQEHRNKQHERSVENIQHGFMRSNIPISALTKLNDTNIVPYHEQDAQNIKNNNVFSPFQAHSSEILLNRA